MSLIRDSLKKVQEKENTPDKTVAVGGGPAQTGGGLKGSRTLYVLLGVGLLLIVGVYFLLLPGSPPRAIQPKPAAEVKESAGGPLPRTGPGPAAAPPGPSAGPAESKAEILKGTPPPATAKAETSAGVRPLTLATLPPSKAATDGKAGENLPVTAGISSPAATRREGPPGTSGRVPAQEVRKVKGAGPPETKSATAEKAAQSADQGIVADSRTQENLKKAYEQAYAWQQEGRLEQAQARYREILAQDPANPYVLTNLGLLYQKTGRLREAVQAYEKAIEADPQMVPALQNLGVVWIRLGNNEEAGRWLERSLALDPNNAVALANLGVLYNKKGNRELARQYWKKSLLRDPRLPEVCYNLARLEETAGNIPEAYRYYQQFIRLRSDSGDPLVQGVERHIRDWKLPGPGS